MRLVLLAIAATFASPAAATGGFACRTAAGPAIAIDLGFGRVAGAPLLADTVRLRIAGRPVAVRAAQWWLDREELRVVLTDPAGQRREAIVRARRNGAHYDGTVWRNARSSWIRCRES